MTDPVNVPGTSHEHANWQRKVTVGHRGRARPRVDADGCSPTSGGRAAS